MPVELVVNGFFRSGTTIIWKIIRDSNIDCMVFYEPCNAGIFDSLREFGDEGKSGNRLHRWHDMELWHEYFKVPGLIQKMNERYPNHGAAFPKSGEAVEEYVQVFHALPEKVVLQTNRWHFHLERLHNAFGTRIIHVVRNPIDVFSSIQRLFMNDGCSFKRRVKNLFYYTPFFFGRAFQLGELYECVISRFPEYNLPTRMHLYSQGEFFSLFMAVWVIVNLKAAEQIESCGGDVVVYEELVSDPTLFRYMLERKYGLFFAHEGKLRIEQRKACFVSAAERKRINRALSKFGLQQEAVKILDLFNNKIARVGKQ